MAPFTNSSKPTTEESQASLSADQSSKQQGAAPATVAPVQVQAPLPPKGPLPLNQPKKVAPTSTPQVTVCPCGNPGIMCNSCALKSTKPPYTYVRLFDKLVVDFVQEFAFVGYVHSPVNKAFFSIFCIEKVLQVAIPNSMLAAGKIFTKADLSNLAPDFKVIIIDEAVCALVQESKWLVDVVVLQTAI